MIQELATAIKNKHVILFVGSGVPKNLGLPVYSELMNQMAINLGYDPVEFKAWGNNDFLILAEYYYHHKGTLGALRSWMDRLWHHKDIAIEESEIYKLIIDLDFPIIYTTNFDRWLENAYDFYQKEYIKIANVADIARIKMNKTQIIKFHGDFDDDSSLVFIGYSLSDINIRYMLYKLHLQWKDSNYEHIRPKSYIFLVEPNPIKESLLKERGIIPIVSNHDEPGVALTNFLKEIKNSM